MNALLTSLVTDVYTLTNRPDLVGETLLAVRNATLKAHSQDYFYKDLFETGIQLDASNRQQSIDYKQLIPLWKSLKYLRKYTPSLIEGIEGVEGDILTVLTPDNVVDSYGINKENVCYVAGNQLQIRSSTPQQYFILGCYVRPDVTINNFNSWIAEESPMAIIYEAASVIFKTIGYDEQNATYTRLVQEEYRALIATNLQVNGY